MIKERMDSVDDFREVKYRADGTEACESVLPTGL